MVVVLKDGANKSDIMMLCEYLDAYNVKVSVTEGVHTTILGLVGDTSSVDQDTLRAMPFVQTVKRIQEPYKAANKDRGRQFSGHSRAVLRRVGRTNC